MGILFKHEVASQLCPLLTEYGANPADSPGELGGWDGAGLGGRQQRVAEFREAVAWGCWSVGEGGTRWDRCVKGIFVQRVVLNTLGGF